MRHELKPLLRHSPLCSGKEGTSRECDCAPDLLGYRCSCGKELPVQAIVCPDDPEHQEK